MVEIKSSNIRALIMDLLKQKFGIYTLWREIEVELAILVSSIPEATTDEKKDELVDKLREIKAYLIKHQIKESELTFLDEEIDGYEQTKQISLYEQREDQLDPELVAKYARSVFGKEGIIGIHLSLNYEQLKKLVNRVYEATGLIKFYISREKTIYGKVVAEIFDTPQTVPIATLLESTKLGPDGEPMIKKVALFGEKIDKKKYFVVKEIEAEFRTYKFISEHKQELVLLTSKEINLGDYIVTGVVTQMFDYKALTETTKILTKLPIMFVQEARNRILEFKDHAEFKRRLNHIGITKTNTFNFPFTVPIEKKNKDGMIEKNYYSMNHPKWFKWLVWAWLTHENQGVLVKYPLHILMVGPPMSGKSTLLDGLHMRSKETLNVFSGVSSTLKYLVPSFKYRPAKVGYLGESNRFAYCDEFLRATLRTRTVAEGGKREEAVGLMNDLLEHRTREAGSGVAQTKVSMTARVFATSNPVKGIHCVEDMTRSYDMAFLSRWLIYYQSEEHYQMARRSKLSQLRKHKFLIPTNEWIGILDYLQTIKTVFDEEKVDEIKQMVVPILSADLKKHYDARHTHHIHCIIDGIIKTRCLFQHDISFRAKKEDYEILRTIWLKVISSWVDVEFIKNLPLQYRIDYLPENAQYLYQKICDEKGIVSRIRTEEIALEEMTKAEYYTSYIILKDNELIIEEDGFVKPHWMKKDEKQSRIQN